MWSRKQKRCFQRVMCGFRRHGKKRLRFMTLTTAEGFVGNINECFSSLRQRIGKLTVNSLINAGYLSEKDAVRFYGKGFDFDAKFPFDYIKIHTKEGQHGVLHVLYFGKYIPQRWLSDRWNVITDGSYVVDIRQCRRRVYNAFKLGCYVVAQYVVTQKDKVGHGSDYLRFNASADWCFKGFIRAWFNVKRIFVREDRIVIFNYLIDCYRDGVDPDREWIWSHTRRV